MARPIHLTLHIGLQKTGTTLIQQSLRRLRPVLSEHGIAYIDRLDIYGLESLRGWSAFKNNRPDLHSSFIRDLRALAEERINGMEPRSTGWRGSPARIRQRLAIGREETCRVLVSDESLVGTNGTNYHRPFRPNAEPAILDMIEALEPESTRLVLYVRRQDRLIESAYMQRIHAGHAYSFKKYLSRIDEGPIMDFDNLLGRLEKLPTVTTVATRPFEFIGSGSVLFVADFLDAAGMPGIDVSSIADLQQSNPSYTEPAYRAALKINRHIKTKEQQERVRRFLKTLLPAGDYPSVVLLQEAQRRAYLDLYREANESFFRKRHPELPADAYSTPQATDQLASYLAAT